MMPHHTGDEMAIPYTTNSNGNINPQLHQSDMPHWNSQTWRSKSIYIRGLQNWGLYKLMITLPKISVMVHILSNTVQM